MKTVKKNYNSTRGYRLIKCKRIFQETFVLTVKATVCHKANQKVWVRKMKKDRGANVRQTATLDDELF